MLCRRNPFSNNHFATLDGLLFFLNTNLYVSFIYRDYSPRYYSYYGSAIGQNSTIGNEKGFLLQSNFRYSDFRVRAYVDLFSFPWLRYQVNIPSEGDEILFECSRTTDRSDIQLRYKYKKKITNISSENTLDSLAEGVRENIRLNTRLYWNSSITTQTRCEIGLYHTGNQIPKKGIMLFQDLTLKPQKLPISLSLRLAWFNAPEYDARIYAYEKDVLYAYTSQQFYGKGWKWMGIVRWAPIDQLTIWFKISQARYPGKSETGSGLATINNFHKTEVKLQMLLTLH